MRASFSLSYNPSFSLSLSFYLSISLFITNLLGHFLSLAFVGPHSRVALLYHSIPIIHSESYQRVSISFYCFMTPRVLRLALSHRTVFGYSVISDSAQRVLTAARSSPASGPTEAAAGGAARRPRDARFKSVGRDAVGGGACPRSACLSSQWNEHE